MTRIKLNQSPVIKNFLQQYLIPSYSKLERLSPSVIVKPLTDENGKKHFWYKFAIIGIT
jgi:hypothetical protein